MKFKDIDLYSFLGIKKSRRTSADLSVDKNIIVSGKRVSVGRYSYGYEDATIYSLGEDGNITIGRFCSFAFGLKLYCGVNHRVDWISTYPFGHVPNFPINLDPVKGHPQSNGDICIGNDVWIGGDVTILSGITIGDGSVIAANSHVVSDVAPYTVVGGNPANKIKQRFPDEIVNRLLQIKWWNYPIEKIKSIVPFLCNQQGEIISDNLTQIEQLLQKTT